MDYISTSFNYKVKKVLRYIELYGPIKTLKKVRSLYHMNSHGKSLDEKWLNKKSSGLSENKNVGIIGCGNFAFSHISFYINMIQKNCIRAAYDPIGDRSISFVKNCNAIYASSSAEELISDPKIKKIYIASNHSSHAEYAIKAIESQKAVHIEKPHVINKDQLERLISAYKKNPNSKVYLGFNRPESKLFKDLKNYVDAESGSISISWFIAGHKIEPNHWYYDESEGGRILGNLCHWTDLSLRLVGLEKAFPIVVSTLNPKDSDSNFSISILFGDKSLASISFSCKGHTFEGVREYLNIHKGDLLASLRDFKDLRLDRGSKRIFKNLLFRDHGHKAALRKLVLDEKPESLKMIIETARLFLAVKDSVDNGKTITLNSFNEGNIL